MGLATWGTLLWLTAASAFAAPRAHCRHQELAEDRMWLRLGHYRPSWPEGFESRADGALFFLSPHGKSDPCAELEATIAAMEEGRLVGTMQQAAVCAFPARRRFLEAALGRRFADVSCPHWDAWRKGLNADSVTVVYSSAYANHPASMFGHLLVRLDPPASASASASTSSSLEKSPTERAREDLLGYGVNFAAVTSQEDRDFLGAVYAFKGLFGGYPGQFAVAPYYMKVNEYNNAESRDLWELRLALTKEQVDRLVEHLWELYAHTHFDYYFLDENCAYQILAWLDTANADWNLAERLRMPTPPSDAVRLLAEIPGLIGSVHMRPSNYRVVLERFASLDAGDHHAALALANGKSRGTKLQGTAALDALLELLLYRKYARHGELDTKERTLLSSTLRERAHSQGAPTADVHVTPPNNRPDLGAPPAVVGLGGLRRSGITLGMVSWSPGYHDLLADDTGYEPWTSTEYLATRLAWRPKSSKDQTASSYLFSSRLLDVNSLRPWDSLDPKPSWRLKVAAQSHAGWRARQDNERDLRALGGVGGAFHPYFSQALVYGFAQAFVERRWTPGDSAFGLGPAAAFGLVVAMSSQLKVQVHSEAGWDLLKKSRHPSVRQTHLAGRWSLARRYELGLVAESAKSHSFLTELRVHY